MTYENLIEYFKTQSAIAQALNISQASVCVWQKRTVPYLRQAQIERITKGKLKAKLEHDARSARAHA